MPSHGRWGLANMPCCPNCSWPVTIQVKAEYQPAEPDSSKATTDADDERQETSQRAMRSHPDEPRAPFSGCLHEDGQRHRS